MRTRGRPAGPRYKKRWGQHHLVHPDLCDPLVRFLEAKDRDVVEIGPGGGVLTGRLVEAGARVVACDVDLDWLAHAARIPDLSTVRWVALDARNLAWDRLPEGCRITGNLPFNVATPLLIDLLARGDRIDRLGFMVQKEVADRLLAGPGEPERGALGVWAQAWTVVTHLGVVRPGSFRPPPKVAGAFVGLRYRDELPLPRTQMAGLGELIRAAFGQRRKTLRNSLGSLLGRGEAGRLLEAAGIEPARRAEELSVDEFVRLERLRQTEF